MAGPLAQSAERGADNAKVVSSILTRTIKQMFPFAIIILHTILSVKINLFFFLSFRNGRYLLTLGPLGPSGPLTPGTPTIPAAPGSPARPCSPGFPVSPYKNDDDDDGFIYTRLKYQIINI